MIGINYFFLDTHLQRNSTSVFFLENKQNLREFIDLTDDEKEKHSHDAVLHPPRQVIKIGHSSSWLVPLCHVQWLLPLLPFCDKHREQSHASLMVPTKSANEIRSKNYTSTGSVRKGTYLLLRDNHIFPFHINYCTYYIM